MANQVNYTTTQRLAFTPVLNSVIFDTTLKQFYLGDGSTVGGNPITSALPGYDSRTGLTGADGAPITLLTTTAAGQIYRVSADIFATAAVTGTANYTLTWTENSTTQTMLVTATVINTLGTASNIIRPDNATTITAQLTGTFTGTFSVVGLVERLI